MNAKQAGVRRGVEEGSASLYGWRYRRLSQRGDELLLNSENLKAFKHICHDAISHYRQKKNIDGLFDPPTSRTAQSCVTSTTISDKTRGRLQTSDVAKGDARLG